MLLLPLLLRSVSRGPFYANLARCIWRIQFAPTPAEVEPAAAASSSAAFSASAASSASSSNNNNNTGGGLPGGGGTTTTSGRPAAPPGAGRIRVDRVKIKGRINLAADADKIYIYGSVCTGGTDGRRSLLVCCVVFSFVCVLQQFIIFFYFFVFDNPILF